MTLDEYLRMRDALAKMESDERDRRLLNGAPKLPVTTDPRRDLVVGSQSEDGDVGPLLPWGDP